MNILIVIHFFPPHVGGMERVAFHHAVELGKRGHMVTVVTSAIPKKMDAHEYPANMRVVRVCAWNPFERFGVPFPFFSPRLLMTLFREVRRADVVHIHDVQYQSSFVASVWAWVMRKPVVLMQHVDVVEHPNKIVRMVQRLVYATTGAFTFRTSARVLTLNDRVKDFVLRHGVQRKRLVEVVNGVDTTRFHVGGQADAARTRTKYGLCTDLPVVLFVGRFVPKKGFHTVVAAQDDGYQIACVGGETNIPSTERIVFLGERSPDEVAELYRVADLFVLPSRSEGFPCSIQEAMASGVPVVMTYDAGYARYGLDATMVYFLREPTVEATRSAVRSLLADPARRARMKAYGREYAQAHFDWDKVCETLEGVYRAVVDERIRGVQANTSTTPQHSPL